MKNKYLFQALKFACLPTLSVLILIVCGFFSITRALDWISSDNGFAIALRILLIIGEIILVSVMYKQYEKEGIKEEARLGKTNNNGVSRDYDFTLSSLFEYNNYRRRDNYDYIVYSTESHNIKIVEAKSKI